MNANLEFIKGYLNYYRTLETKRSIHQNLFFALTLLISGILLLLILGNIFFFTSTTVLWIRFLFFAVVVFLLLKTYLSILSIKRTSYSQLAILLERKFPCFDTHLINAIQLGDTTHYPNPFINRLTEDARNTIYRIDPLCAIDRKKLFIYRKTTLVSLILFFIYVILSPGGFKNSFIRILFPSVIAEREVRVEPGNAEIEKGSPLTIRVYLNDGSTSPYVEIKNMQKKREELVKHRMFFTCYIPYVKEMFYYRIIYGDRKTTGWFRIDVKEPTFLHRMNLTYIFPAYTGQKSQKEEKSFSGITTLYGTKIIVETLFTNPVGDTYLLFGDGEVLVNRGIAKKKVFQFTANKATLFEFRYYDPLTGQFKKTPRELLNITFDNSPYVEFINPGRDVFGQAGKTINLKVRAKDDLGLTAIRIRKQMQRGVVSRQDPILYRTTISGRKTEYTAETLFRLPGDFSESVGYYAECDDTSPEGNTGFSSVYYIYPGTGEALRIKKDGKEMEQVPTMKKIEVIKTSLEKFASEEKNIIEVAKKVMENRSFSTDRAMIQDIIENQKKWADLFQKMVDDLNRMGTQTKGSFTLSEELVEMVSHLQISNQHLAKSTIHLAIPASQSGLELAKELTSNLERWLSEYPDYIKWEMEEPPANYNVPEAELPEELEDIIGDLLEQEEDMREEIEDITSSWMDSLDKGAGWGAADGPISNMSAKGITGNLMPNQQEVGGRSGEGRTGRSYGEMVERTAIGKGGRRTPARLTPDNLESGEIQDTSGEQPFGPTGGGKVSGWGAQGLTGPVQDLLFRYNTLSQKQQKLIEKTEGFIRNMQVINVYNPEMESALRAMKEFQVKLHQGRYTDLLTEKQKIISHLQQANQFFTKTRILKMENNERSPIKTISPEGSIWDERIPTGYENLVRKYYREIYK